MNATLRKIVSGLFGGSATKPKPTTGGGRDRVLMHFKTLDNRGRKVQIPWTLREAVPGVFVTGGAGSGKTSAVLREIAGGILSQTVPKIGGLVLCVKSDEAEEFAAWCEAAGRSADVIRVTHDGPHLLNLLAHEAAQPSATVESLVELCCMLGEAAGGADRKQDEWQEFVRTNLRNALCLMVLANEHITFSQILALAQQPAVWNAMHAKAAARSLTESQRHDLAVCAQYYGQDWATLAPATKSGIMANLVSFLDPLSRGELRRLFSTETTLTPEVTLNEGKIIIVDLPILRFEKLGKLAAVIWRLAWARAISRRGKSDQISFCWVDEFQNVLTSDMGEHLLTCRSSGGLYVLATQGIPGVWHAMGGKAKAEGTAGMLLGNLSTKIMCRNSCGPTNQWASELVGKSIQLRNNSSSNYNFSQGEGGGGGGSGTSEQMDYEVQPNEFAEGLSPGGPANKLVVTAYVYTGERMPPNHKMLVKCAFNQN